MRTGDSYYLKDLLHAMLLKSANDTAVAIAEGTSGSEARFMKQVNKKMKRIGCKNTLFGTASGLRLGKEHYTTARDVARLSAQLDQHPLYYEFSTIWMDELTHPGGRKTQLTNTNRLIIENFIIFLCIFSIIRRNSSQLFRVRFYTLLRCFIFTSIDVGKETV